MWMGDNIVDPELLRLAGVSMLLVRYKDWASDILVLRLASYDTVDDICQLDCDAGSASVMTATLYFVRAHLYAINAKNVCSNDRMNLLWMSSQISIMLNNKLMQLPKVVYFGIFCIHMWMVNDSVVFTIRQYWMHITRGVGFIFLPLESGRSRGCP